MAVIEAPRLEGALAGTYESFGATTNGPSERQARPGPTAKEM